MLVTAANGNQGKLLLPKLLAAGVPFRACVRSEASASQLAKLGVSDIVAGDIARREVLERALAGVSCVYHVGPAMHPEEREIGLATIEAAEIAGVRHFVFSSVLHSITTALVQHEIKRDVEERLLSSPMEFTILQPSNYMLPLKLRPVFSEAVFRLSWSLDRRQSLVDLDDVTDVVIKVVTEGERHWSATYELVSDGRYTAYDLCTILSEVLDRHIDIEEIDADTYLSAVLKNAAPDDYPHQARVLRAITARYSSHDFLGNSNVLTWLLGRRPTTFAAFVRREHEAFLARNAAPCPGET